MADNPRSGMRLANRARYRATRLRRAIAKLPLTLPGITRPLRFMVLCRPRTGSNHLLSLLEQHPATLVYGEKLHNGRTAEYFLDRLQAPRAAWVRATGFKMFYHHPESGDGEAIWSRLCSDTGLHVIHLRRANLLHTLLSEHLATMTGHWVERKDQVVETGTPRAVRLSAEWLTRRFREIRGAERRCNRWITDHPVLDVTFESLTCQRQQEFDRLCNFLGLPRRRARSYTMRQRRQPARELISNYDELKEAFQGTQWSEFFSNRVRG